MLGRGRRNGRTPAPQPRPQAPRFSVSQRRLTMANVDIATKARWQDVANFVLGAWLFISPWVLGFSDAVATNAWIFGIIIALLALSAIFAYQVGRVADGSHRRLGVHLPMGVGRGIERAHPVELADRRSVAGDPGALVVLGRAPLRRDRQT